MATLTHNLSIFSDGSLADNQLISLPRYWRKPHDTEIVNYDTPDWTYLDSNGGTVRKVVLTNKVGLPEVYRVYPDHQTPLDCKWIQLWKALNPRLNNKVFSSLLDTHLAFTNGTGYPDRFNCLTGEGIGLKPPAFDQPRLCGGALLRPKSIEGGLFYIDGLLTSDSVPTADYVLARPWLWYYGTTILPSGQINYITRLGTDGSYHPVRVPILSKLPLYVPLKWLDELPADFNPANYDPRVISPTSS